MEYSTKHGPDEQDGEDQPFSKSYRRSDYETAEREVLSLFDGDPVPLRSDDVSPFPTDALPEPFAAMVEATATAVQVDTAMVGPMVLGALSAACGGCVEAVARPGWNEVAVLHLAVTADPSERKSAAHEKVTRPLHRAEKMLLEAVEDTRVERQAQRKIADRKAENAAKKAADLKHERSTGEPPPMVDPERHAVDLAKAAEAIVVPSLPRLLADDITPEALATRMAENHGRIAVMSSEAGIFATLAGRYANNVANLDVWLKGYSGDAVRVDRKGRPSEIIDRPALTVCLAAQPDVLARICGNGEFHGRGLLARFSYAMPKSTVGHRDPEAPPVSERIETAYSTALTELAHTLHARQEGPVEVKFDQDAERAVIRLLNEIEKRLIGDGDLAENLREWGGKYAGRVVRIAVLLHMAEHGPSGVNQLVSAPTVAAAARIGEFFVAHARAAFGVADTGAVQLSDLTTSLDYLRRHHETHRLYPIHMRQITKNGPKVLRRSSTRDPVLAVLADLNLISRRIRDGKRVVYLHPKLDPQPWQQSC